MAKNTAKLLLIGWDAADWNHIKPLLKQGLLPTLQTILNNGFCGNLASTEPMISPMLWTTIATGTRAYKHGIHGFVEARPDGSGVRPIRGHHRKVPAVWNLLNAWGRQTHVVGWWPSHPAEYLNGVMLSNFYGLTNLRKKSDWPLMQGALNQQQWQQALADVQVHPDELTSEILSPFFPHAGELPEKDPIVQGVARILAHTSSTHNAITLLMDNAPWDFAAVYYNGLDHFLHLANHYHPPRRSDVSEVDFQRYGHVVTAAYRFFDMMLAQLMTQAGPDAHVLLVSDHGFDHDTQRKGALPEMPGAPALEHQPYGIIAGTGPQWKSGNTRVLGASIMDIAPTILHTFGQPVHRQMEGRVLMDVFQKKQSPSLADYTNIAAWQGLPDQQEALPEHEVLQQLEALGYVSNNIEGPKKAAIEAALRENEYYLALSLVDGRDYATAANLLDRLTQEDPLALRFAFLQLHVLLQINRFVQYETALKTLKKRVPHNDPRIIFYEGIHAMSKNQPLAAFEQFKKLLSSGHRRMGLVYQAGRSLMLAGNPSAAADFFAEVIEKRPEQVQARVDLARCLFELNDAPTALKHLTKVIQQTPALAAAHALAGHIFLEQKLFEEAAEVCATAHKLDPTNLEILHQLIQANEQLGKHEDLEELRKTLLAIGNPVIVVSGLPRSGTSMVMQMLAQGGLKIHTDQQRSADQHNPMGYFEHEAVKTIMTDARFLENIGGQAVKVVAPLVRFLPDHQMFKVVFVKRNLTDVITSQERMKGRNDTAIRQYFPFDLALKLQQSEAETLKVLRDKKTVDLLELNYDQILTDPVNAANTLAVFLDRRLDLQKMAAAVKTDHNHHPLNP
jgi:predicted AlkP superfamily phosphohydrolase/phosphomutase/tetratricopeptide (TPR) repeat protein